MAAALWTLEINEPQVLVHYPNDDDGFFWHHRVLLHRVKAGTSVCLTPTMGLQIHSLLVTSHVVLVRDARFTAEQADEVFAFDPISKADMAHEKRRARTHAAILGEGDLDSLGTSVWIVCGVKDTKFGELVPSEMVEDAALFTSLQARGLLEWDGEVHFCEQVLDSETEKIIKDKRSSELDARTLGMYISTREALPMLTRRSATTGRILDHGLCWSSSPRWSRARATG